MENLKVPILKKQRKSDKAALKALEQAQRVEQQSYEQFLNFDKPTPKQPQPTIFPTKTPMLGRWTQEEHQIYISVLKDSVLTKKQIFVHLARNIPSRGQHQIRAHHQKLLKRFGSIKDIVGSHVLPSSNIVSAITILESIVDKFNEHFKESEDLSTNPNI